MATIRDNNFTLKMKGMSNLKFHIDDHSIHSGQPWKGISKIKCDSGACTMTVRAGRKGSEDVAGWFKKKVGGGMALGCTSSDSMPSKLNFAFIGTMSFDYEGETYTGNDIIIAQGHSSASRNNWWIGGKNMKGVKHGRWFGAIGQIFSKGGFPSGLVGFATVVEMISDMDMFVMSA